MEVRPKINFLSSLEYLLSSCTACALNCAIFFRLLIEGSGKTWKQDQRVRLQHVDTSGYLHSHDKKYTRIAGGQQEVRREKLQLFVERMINLFGAILNYNFWKKIGLQLWWVGPVDG